MRVVRQVFVPRKRLLTHFACVQLFAGVRVRVRVQVKLLRKCFATNFASVATCIWHNKPKELVNVCRQSQARSLANVRVHSPVGILRIRYLAHIACILFGVSGCVYEFFRKRQNILKTVSHNVVYKRFKIFHKVYDIGERRQ